jgi:hypothetical protein
LKQTIKPTTSYQTDYKSDKLTKNRLNRLNSSKKITILINFGKNATGDNKSSHSE